VQEAKVGYDMLNDAGSTRTRLIFLAPSTEAHGPIRAIAETLAESLANEGYSIRFASWGRRSDREHRLLRPFSLLQDTWSVRAMAVEWQPDAVVLHTSSDWVAHVRDLPLVVVLRLAKIPVIAEFHGSAVQPLSETGHFLFKAVSRLIARRLIGLLLLNKESAEVWATFEPGVRTAVVQNPLSPLEGSRATIREIGAQEPVHLIFVGRLIPAKGLRDAVLALAEVLSQRQAVLAVVGEGPELPGILTLAEQLGLSDHIDMVGYADRAGVAERLSQSDIMVFPSYHPEGLPTVVLEAMGAGLPIITTRRWGTADWLEAGIHAVFTPAREPHVLAQAIVSLAEDVGLRRRMSAANLERIGEFAPAVVAERYAETLRSMMGAGTGKPAFDEDQARS
jgi:glycosyltransferase involved in cell wall biosynthesis